MGVLSLELPDVMLEPLKDAARERGVTVEHLLEAIIKGEVDRRFSVRLPEALVMDLRNRGAL